jgi:hypothetical protein
MTSIIVVFFCFLTLTSCVTLIIRLKRRAMQQRILAEQEAAFAARNNLRPEEAA